MKNRTNRTLLAVFFLTAALYAFFLLSWLGVIHIRFFALWPCLGFCFHAVPCFCLQLLVCRAAKRAVLRLIPVFLLLGAAALFTAGLLTSTGWDNLGWGLLLLLCIAPAAGYGLAWAVYGVQRLRQHINQ